MTKLTIARIASMISKHADKIDQTLDVVEDTVGIWTRYGYVWDANDGDGRHVEVVRIGDYETDTVSYLKECIANIVRDTKEA